MSRLTITALSDTHGHHNSLGILPETDVLVFAGDLMTSGYDLPTIVSFSEWWYNQPHCHKILVAGNHDRAFESNEKAVLTHFKDTHYLKDSGVVIEGFKFWGSPYQPEFCNWAFNVPRETIYKHWELIPEDTDVLITHGPPYRKLDQATRRGANLGDVALKVFVEWVNPSNHVFGHIHGGYGETKNISTVFHNVAICDERYRPVNAPQVFEVVN